MSSIGRIQLDSKIAQQVRDRTLMPPPMPRAPRKKQDADTTVAQSPSPPAAEEPPAEVEKPKASSPEEPVAEPEIPEVALDPEAMLAELKEAAKSLRDEEAKEEVKEEAKEEAKEESPPAEKQKEETPVAKVVLPGESFNLLGGDYGDDDESPKTVPTVTLSPVAKKAAEKKAAAKAKEEPPKAPAAVGMGIGGLLGDYDEDDEKDEEEVKAEASASSNAATVEEEDSGGELPENWQEVPDEASGRSYFWNFVTNAVQWTRPKAPPKPQPLKDLMPEYDKEIAEFFRDIDKIEASCKEEEDRAVERETRLKAAKAEAAALASRVAVMDQKEAARREVAAEKMLSDGKEAQKAKKEAEEQEAAERKKTEKESEEETYVMRALLRDTWAQITATPDHHAEVAEWKTIVQIELRTREVDWRAGELRAAYLKTHLYQILKAAEVMSVKSRAKDDEALEAAKQASARLAAATSKGTAAVASIGSANETRDQLRGSSGPSLVTENPPEPVVPPPEPPALPPAPAEEAKKRKRVADAPVVGRKTSAKQTALMNKWAKAKGSDEEARSPSPPKEPVEERPDVTKKIPRENNSNFAPIKGDWRTRVAMKKLGNDASNVTAEALEQARRDGLL